MPIDASRHRRPTRPKQVQPKKDTEPLKATMLKYGRDNNFSQWKEWIRHEIAIQFGLLVTIIDEEALVHPRAVEVGDYDPDEDPHGFKMHDLKTRIDERIKTIAKIKMDMPKCAGFLWKYLSRESIEAVRRHEDYDERVHRNDPLTLYRCIRETHAAPHHHAPSRLPVVSRSSVDFLH